MVLEAEEIESLKLESKKTIDLVQFVDAREVDSRYFERPYFVAPADPLAGEGYVVIRDALARTGRVGLAQVTIGGREWLVAIAPLGDGLVMEMLRYATELRNPAEFFSEVPSSTPQKEMVDLAVQLIEQKTSEFRPEAYTDHYQGALKELVQEKMRGRKIVSAEEADRPTGTNVIDLMEALKRSVGQRASPESKPPAARAAGSGSAQRKSSKAPPKRRKTS